MANPKSKPKPAKRNSHDWLRPLLKSMRDITEIKSATGRPSYADEFDTMTRAGWKMDLIAFHYHRPYRPLC